MNIIRMFLSNKMLLFFPLLVGVAVAHGNRHNLLNLQAGDHSNHVHSHHPHKLDDRSLEIGFPPQCGLPEPTKLEIANSNAVMRKWLDKRNEKLTNDENRDLQLENDIIVIPVCFHIIRPETVTEDDSSFLDAASLQTQLDVLNKTFSSESCCDTSQSWCEEGRCSVDMGIRFAMAFLDQEGNWNADAGTTPRVSDAGTCVTRTRNESWYYAGFNSVAEKDMKYTLRKGNAIVLNVYYKSFLEIWVGLGRLPFWYNLNEKLDGVMVKDSTIVGGTEDKYNEGVSNITCV